MLKLIFIYFTINFHFCLASSIQNFAEISEMERYPSLAQCICEVARQEYLWKPTIAFKLKENNSEGNFFAEFINVIAIEEIPYFTTENRNNTFDLNEANYFYVEHFDSSIELNNFDFDVIETKIKYLLVLDYSQDILADDFTMIGKFVGGFEVTFFIKTIGQSSYNLIKFNPTMDEKTCTINYTPSQINSCENGHLKTSVIFPSKTPLNLMGCAIKIGMGTLYPMAMIENQETFKTYDSLNGITIKGMDIEILKIITDYSNATIDLYYTLIYAENHFRYDHYFPLVLNGSLDLCAGGQYRVFGDQVEYSGVYARQVVNWIYTAERSPHTWQNFIINIDGLYLFVIFYLAYSVAWKCICVFDKRLLSMKDVLLYSFGALVGSSALQDARTRKQKILNIVYLNMCLHLYVYISIQLFSFLTISEAPEILKTNEDIMKSGRIPYLNHLNRYFVQDEKYEVFANTSRECTTFLGCTMKALDKKGLTIIIDSYIYQFQDTVDTMVNDEAKLLMPVENLLTVYHEMIMWKESVIVDAVQIVIKRLFESGITVKLYRDAIGITKVDKAARATRKIMSPEYSCQEGCPISLQQVYGALYLWGIGCALAFVVFLVELRCSSKNKS